MEEKQDYLIQNLKLAIIYGENEVDGKKRDGEIEKIYKYDEDTAHFYYMKKFLETNFKESEDLQKSLEDKDINSIAYEIQKLGHIVMAESTSQDSNRRVIMYLPEDLSEKQKISINNLIEKLNAEKYKVISLFDLRDDGNGSLDGKQKIGSPEILNEYIKYISNKKQKNRLNQNSYNEEERE